MTLSIVDTFDMIDMDHEENNEENNEIMFKEDSCMFNLSVTNDDLMKRRVEEYAKRLLKKRTYATKINFEEVNKKNKDLGTAGELLAFEYEQNRLVSEHIPYNAEYVANTIGDGLGYDILSYDKDGNEINLIDVIKMENKDITEEINTKDNVELLYKYINKLTKREKEIIIRRYGLFNNKEMTQKEIAKEMMISRSYVSRIEKRAISKILKEFIKSNKTL